MSNPSSEFINDHYDYEPTSKDKDVGGNSQEWKEILRKVSQEYKKQSKQKAGINLEDHLDVILKNVNRIDFPIVLDPKISTFDDVAIHGILRQRLSKNTVVKRIRYAKFMESHPVPVNFRNPSYENFIRHVDYREQIEFEEGKGYSALDHEWKTMKMFLTAYGMEIWNYKPPSFPKYRAKIIPFPETVNKFLHLEFSKDPYTNALLQYMLTHNFVIGWRIPSEPFMMKVQDVTIDGRDRGFIKITEPKKHYSTRTIIPTEIMTNRRRKSFKNWIDVWRPKVEHSKSGDALYLKPDGSPFKSKEQLRMFLNRNALPQIQEIYPEYHNYIARDYCAISRLIRSKLETKHFDVYEAKEWLGHTTIQTTMSYIKDTKKYFRLAPFDWINRTLKATKKSSGESAKKSKASKITGFYPKSLRERPTGLWGFEPQANRLRADCSA